MLLFIVFFLVVINGFTTIIAGDFIMFFNLMINIIASDLIARSAAKLNTAGVGVVAFYFSLILTDRTVAILVKSIAQDMKFRYSLMKNGTA